jgi:tetratricopeptide (TPR) repeat protein
VKDALMMWNRRWCAAFVAALMAGACATTSPLVRQECSNPDAQLARVLTPLEALRAKGCDASPLVEQGRSECDRLRRELERLAVICPAHVPTLMANAVVAYDQHQAPKAQQFLELILAQPQSHPDASVLRARIAIEDGNLPFARRLVEQQIRLVPDHAGLHEIYAATLFLERKLSDARRELATAAAFGAPRWRIAYHLGLIEEAEGRFNEARRYFSEALEGNPDWAPARSHLNGLRPPTDSDR